jgi:hypothetical protein
MNTETLEAEVIDHRVQLARLDERLNNLPTRAELHEAFDALSDRLHQGFDAAGVRSNTLQEVLGTHGLQIGKLEERIGNLPTRKELYTVAAIQVIATIGAMAALAQVLKAAA